MKFNTAENCDIFVNNAGVKNIYVKNSSIKNS